MRVKRIDLESTSSTQTWIRDHLDQMASSGITMVTAERQTMGRGQFQRPWISPPGNLYTSLYFTLPHEQREVERLAQLLALSAAHILQARGYRISMKWPNDLLLEGKKVAGTLCETLSAPHCLRILAAIGINIELKPEYLDEIDQPATSLRDHSGQAPTPDELAEELAHQFSKDLERFLQMGFAPFLSQMDRLLIHPESRDLERPSERDGGGCARSAP